MVLDQDQLFGYGFEFAFGEGAEEGVGLEAVDCVGQLFVGQFIGHHIKILSYGVAMEVCLFLAVPDAVLFVGGGRRRPSGTHLPAAHFELYSISNRKPLHQPHSPTPYS